MAFRNFILLETAKESCIPLLISTIIHTSLILGFALWTSGGQRPTLPAFSASFGSVTTDSSELISIEFVNPTLDATDEPTSFDNEVDVVAFEHSALTDLQVSMQSKPVSEAEKSPATRWDAEAVRNSTTRKTKVAHVSTSTKSLSFGKRNDFGAKQFVLGSSPTLEVTVPGLDPLGSRILNQAGNLSLTGGAMMVSTALPASELENTPLRFSYDATQDDGRRLVVNAGTRTATLPIYDWELLPLAKFADSGHNGAVSIQMSSNHDQISLDAAFNQTLLGLRFIQADLMPRGIIMSQQFLPQDASGILVGPGEQDRLAADHEVQSAVHELQPLMERTRNGASYSVLTDAGVRFIFDFDDTELVITGTPYFFFWEPSKKGDQVTPKKALNDALKMAWPQIKKANPLVIESMERCFRTVAFFRFQKQTSPANWEAFRQQVSEGSLRPVATPAFLTN